MKNLIVLFLFLSVNQIVSALQPDSCGKIYDSPEEMAFYGNADDDMYNKLSTYFNHKIVPLISECHKRDSILITSLYVTLTINTEGYVIDAEILKPHMTALCKSELVQELRKMKGWKPAKQNGVPVCSRFNYPIRCMYWK